MTDDEERDQLKKLDEAVRHLDFMMAALRSIAADEGAPRKVRLDAALELVGLRHQLRRMVPDAAETLVRLAYGDPGSDRPEPVPATVRSDAIKGLIERGIATRQDLETLPMETLITRTRERLAREGVVDDTGQAG